MRISSPHAVKRRGFAVGALVGLTAVTCVGTAATSDAASNSRRRRVKVVAPTTTGTPTTVSPQTSAPTNPSSTPPSTTPPSSTPSSSAASSSAPSAASSSPVSLPMATLVSVTNGNSSADKPGTLVKSEPLTTVPDGSRGYKVTYRSQSVSGQPIDVTGVVIVPKTKAPPQGWPVLSYAHGTVGLADRCTPSNKLSEIELTLATVFNGAGIAVVASDFEGFGTPGRHPYLVGESEGRGVLDIVRAARQLPNEKLNNKFAVWGHSQGGHAALFAGELATSWAPELKLIGVVAGAPPSQLTDVGNSLENSPFRGYVFMVAAGMHAAYPSLDLSKVLTQKGLDTLKVVDTGCNREVFRAFANGPLDDYLKRDGLANDTAWQEALRRNEPGQRKTPAPILIVHGDKDEQIPVATSATLKTKLCALGNNVDRRVYNNQDHGGAAVASLFDVLTWLGARSFGISTKSKC